MFKIAIIAKSAVALKKIFTDSHILIEVKDLQILKSENFNFRL